ncbi:GLPGLI family protein [Flavobacterium dankookense]|uniref:GLPGLI family protein n=2 Tax=Flavobacterium dankookense TaxID=706186 RepID=A0A4R6QH49_9FLAO|nr:GLPGLI family protein [Flavobacterium dankookense]
MPTKTMKSKNLIIIILLSIQFCFGQKNSAYIEYGVKIYDDNGSFTKDKMFADTFLNAVKEANKLTFGLIISDKGSKFYEVNNGIEQNYEIGLAKIYANYMGIIYNIENDIIKESQLLGNNIFTKENKIENWILTTETKIIDSYICFKATNTYTVINPKGTFKYPVTAWYCPKLPYSYGPNGYGNLPGLILELQVRNVNFGIKKITLESDLQFNLEFLKTAKILTEEELNKKLDEFNNFEGK